MDAILNVYKPVGPTSHDVVARVRRLARQQRVGHAGTLDPAACGVLVVCLGQATRMIEYMAEHDKEYCAAITFGQATDTYDATGRPTSEPSSISFGREALEEAVSGFVGEVSQVPPTYSAIKQGGQPLYKLARAGQDVSASPRTVRIYAIDLLSWDPPTATVRVSCGKGTYIRSLAHDMGQRLGVGAHLSGLVRLANGPFRIDDACTLDELAAAFADGYAAELAFPLDEAALKLPAVVLDEPALALLRHGSRWSGPEAAATTICRTYSTEGEIVAMIENEDGATLWRPRKVFGGSE